MWRTPVKLVLLVLGLIVALPVGASCALLKRSQFCPILAHYYLKYAAWVIGLRITVHGALLTKRPLIVVSNHISYLDIIALGATAPLIFTPKAEIAGWPLIGWCCRVMGCVFIERKRQKTVDNMAAIRNALDQRHALVLFAEGTTSDSKRILPIRSSYFQLIEDGFQTGQPIALQPALLRYTRIHNLPIDTDSRHLIAWYGDMDLVSHVNTLFQLGPIDVALHFLPELSLTNSESRKMIAQKCEAELQRAAQDLR